MSASVSGLQCVPHFFVIWVFYLVLFSIFVAIQHLLTLFFIGAYLYLACVQLVLGLVFYLHL